MDPAPGVAPPLVLLPAPIPPEDDMPPDDPVVPLMLPLFMPDEPLPLLPLIDDVLLPLPMVPLVEGWLDPVPMPLPEPMPPDMPPVEPAPPPVAAPPPAAPPADPPAAPPAACANAAPPVPSTRHAASAAFLRLVAIIA